MRAQASGSENFVDLTHQIAQVEGLGQNLGISGGAGLARMQGNSGKSCNEQDLETGNYLRRTPGELDSIKPGHDDISQKPGPVTARKASRNLGRRGPVIQHHRVLGFGKK